MARKARTVAYSNRLSILLIFVLAGCSIAPPHAESFMVMSEPEGAEVFILGELAGRAPLSVSTAQVFPATYPPDREHLYGRVVVRKDGCAEQTVPVGTRAVAAGIKVQLDCAPESPQPATQDDVASRLQRLDRLLQDGTITQQEHELHRRRILDSL